MSWREIKHPFFQIYCEINDFHTWSFPNHKMLKLNELLLCCLSEQAAHGRFPQPEGRRSGRVYLQEVIEGPRVAAGYWTRWHPLCGQRAETQRQKGPKAPLKGRQVRTGKLGGFNTTEVLTISRFWIKESEGNLKKKDYIKPQKWRKWPQREGFKDAAQEKKYS